MAAYTPKKDDNQEETMSPLREGGHPSYRPDLTSGGSASKAVWYSRNLTPYEENPNISTFSYGSLEAYGGDEINQSTNIFEELEELRCQNQKLVETNEALHRRLETTEESRTELLNKVEDAKYTINSLQVKQCYFKEQACKVQEEMKQLENSYLALQTKVEQLEKEKQSMGKTIRLLEIEDNEKLTLRQTIASLEDEMERAKLEVVSKDLKLKEVMAHRDELIEEVMEENKNYHELYQTHKDLQAAFQALKIERGDMEQTGIKPSRSSVGDELCDKNENLFSELRTVVNGGAGPSPICGLVNYETTSTEMIAGLQSMVDSMSEEMEKLMFSQLSSQSDQEVFEQLESKRRASVAAVLGFGSSPHSASDGRNRFASLANAALIDRGSISPLATRSSLEPVIKEAESEKGDSPRSDVSKKKLSIAISGSNHSSELPQLSPIKPIPSPTSSSPTNKVPLLNSTPVVISGEGEAKGNVERTKTEEEIFQQGFEQGVRSQISQELDDLRDQQRALCENLEEIMEAAEDEDDEENEKNSETQPMLKWMRHCSKNIPWSKASKIGRLLLTGTLFILAIISIIGTVLPLERCTGGATVLSAPWEEVVRVLGPYTNIYNPRPPPK